MSLPFSAWILILGLVGMTLIIWMPYIWPVMGYYFRRSEGPWLLNFDYTRLAKVIIRDMLYTIGLWLGLLFLGISINTPYFWIIFTVGMCCIFGSAWISDKLDKYNNSTPGIMLFSSNPFTQKTLREFLASLGVFIPGKQQPYIGRLSYPGGYIWIDNRTESFIKASKHYFKQHNAEMMQFEEYQTSLRSRLNGDIKTVLFLNILQAKDLCTGERATMEFIQRFSQYYACVVEDAYGNLHTGQEICAALDRNELILGFQKKLLEGNDIKKN